MPARTRAEPVGTRTETTFRLSPKRTSPFKSAGESLQSTAGSRGVRFGVINAGHTMLRGRMRVLATHSIRQFPPHFPSRATPLPPYSERSILTLHDRNNGRSVRWRTNYYSIPNPSSSYMALELFIEFWPSQPTLSIFFCLEQGSSSLVLLFHVPIYNHNAVFRLARFGLCPLIRPAFIG